MWRLGSATWAAIGMAVVFGASAPVVAALVDDGTAGGGAALTPAPPSATVVRLSRMHHAANRQVDLGRLAQNAANRPETRAYGAHLATDFEALDGRIVATGEPLGVDRARLERIYAGENTAALSREADDLTRLAGAHGDAFDRQFWVIVAHDQLAAADMLAPVADADSRLDPIAVDLGRALEDSSRLALVASRPVAGPTPVSTPPPVVPSPDIPAPPITTPGPWPGAGTAMPQR
jgi:hypothetical protein